MNREELLNRLTDIEWEDFEAKKASDELPKTVWETVSAFSNSAGGWIVFGGSQQGKGVELTGLLTNPAKSRIRVFADRIEFEKPGAFPRSIDTLLKKDISIPRNPVLAKLFRCAKLADNAGYDFDKMLKWGKSTHIKVCFKNNIDMALVVFRAV